MLLKVHTEVIGMQGKTLTFVLSLWFICSNISTMGITSGEIIHEGIILEGCVNAFLFFGSYQKCKVSMVTETGTQGIIYSGSNTGSLACKICNTSPLNYLFYSS